jgi:hypothetical protein
MNYNLNINNNYTNENNNNTNDTIFDKLDKKIFGLKGKTLIKKYKKEIVLFVIILLIILTTLYCIIPDNNIIQNGGDPEDMEGPKKKNFKYTRAALKKHKSLDSSRGSKAIRSYSKRGIGAIENKLSENKEYLKNMAIQIVTFFIVVIVFMPSVSFIIIILITFNILKPKIKYVKSL